MKIKTFKRKYLALSLEDQEVTISEMDKSEEIYIDQDVHKAFLNLITWCKNNKKDESK